jgi:hypothetical protein
MRLVTGGCYCGGVIKRGGAVHPVTLQREGEEEYCLYPNLIYFNEVDRGGHFAAWEQLQLFSEEVRAAFRSLR